MDLQEIRRQIDQVDGQLVALFEKRMDLVSQVAAYKKEHGKPIFDPEREKALLDKISQLVEKEDYKETILASFESIMVHSRAYQAQKLGVED